MSKRILVVEDRPDNRQIIRDMLSDTDYEITEAEDGEQALAAVTKQRPDLILMGIQLPIMDGYEVTRQIKADPAMRSIPIIAVTSYVEEQKAQAAGGTCTGCHGSDARGGPQAPSLVKGYWLIGDGSLKSLEETIVDGVPNPHNYEVPMPPKGYAPLSDSDVAAVAAYVWAISHRKG